MEYKGIKPHIAESAYVHDSAVVIGKVTIGRDASVWCNVTIRGDVEEIVIGERTNVQDGTVIHTDYGYPTVVGNGVSIGHNAVLHGCKVGDNCLIGMGAIVLNGAVIGRDSIVAAGSVVTQSSVIPAGSMVMGLPGKVVRKLAPEEIEKIKENVNHYTEKNREYRNIKA